MSLQERVRTFLQSRFADSIIKETNFRDEQSFYLKPESLTEVCEALMAEPDLIFIYLKDITSVDWLNHAEESSGRFEVIYNLYSLKHRYRFFLKIRLNADNPTIDSLTALWRGANWMEREVWDMMGIEFNGHPDLTKILTPDELEGHPLRRDFPLTYEVPQFTWNKDDPPEVIK